MNFSLEEELPIILRKKYELNSHIKGYHAYMMKWNPTLGEYSCSQKMQCCEWTFIKRKNWSIRKNYLIFVFVEAMKNLAKLKLLGEE